MGQLPLFFLVLLASVVTMPLARKTGVPQPVLMTLLGIVMALVPQIPDVTIEPELILPLVLPPLIFAVARRSSVRYFKANVRSILLLAVALVVVTTAAVAGAVHWLLPALPVAAAIAVGALVSPPDPVAAVAVAGSVGLPRRLVSILESEGLFNDVTAIVVYSLAIEAVVSGDFSIGHAVLRFILSAVLAVVVGIALGWVNTKLAERLDDPTQQVALNLLVPFAAYAIAEEIHGSGVLAVVVCALYLAERASDADAVSFRLVGNAFWEVVEILITGVAFGLIGLELATVLKEAGRGWTGFIGDAAVVIGVVVVVRLLWLLPAGWLSKKLRSGDDEDTPFSWKESVILWWSGMRGVATVALALAIPLTLHSGEEFPSAAAWSSSPSAWCCSPCWCRVSPCPGWPSGSNWTSTRTSTSRPSASSGGGPPRPGSGGWANWRSRTGCPPRSPTACGTVSTTGWPGSARRTTPRRRPPRPSCGSASGGPPGRSSRR